MSLLNNINIALKTCRTELHPILLTALIGGWTLCLLYESPILYALTAQKPEHGLDINFANQLCLGIGLMLGFLVRAKSFEELQRAHMLIIVACFLLSSGAIIFDTFLKYILPLSALFGGVAMALCGHYIKSCIPQTQWKRAAPAILILGTLFLTCTHILIVTISINAGVIFSQVMLGTALALPRIIAPPAAKLSCRHDSSFMLVAKYWQFFLFISLIAVNSGIMFHTLFPLLPSYQGLEILFSIPYIVAVASLSLLHKMNKYLLLHLSLIFWGVALILFSCFGQSVVLLVILMLHFTAGSFDIFWWSIGTTGFHLVGNPSSLFGSVLGINILGVLLGGLLSSTLTAIGVPPQITVQGGTALILLTTFFLILVNKGLSPLLHEHGFLEKPQWTAPEKAVISKIRQQLSPRKMDVFQLLRDGLRDKEVSTTLNISPETVKTHNRKIYTKLGIKNRIELRQQFPKAKPRNDT